MGASSSSQPLGRVRTVLAEGPPPARAARARPADVVARSPVLALTPVPAAGPEPPFWAP